MIGHEQDIDPALESTRDPETPLLLRIAVAYALATVLALGWIAA